MKGDPKLYTLKDGLLLLVDRLDDDRRLRGRRLIRYANFLGINEDIKRWGRFEETEILAPIEFQAGTEPVSNRSAVAHIRCSWCNKQLRYPNEYSNYQDDHGLLCEPCVNHWYPGDEYEKGFVKAIVELTITNVPERTEDMSFCRYLESIRVSEPTYQDRFRGVFSGSESSGLNQLHDIAYLIGFREAADAKILARLKWRFGNARGLEGFVRKQCFL